MHMQCGCMRALVPGDRRAVGVSGTVQASGGRPLNVSSMKMIYVILSRFQSRRTVETCPPQPLPQNPKRGPRRDWRVRSQARVHSCAMTALHLYVSMYGVQQESMLPRKGIVIVRTDSVRTEVPGYQ